MLRLTDIDKKEDAYAKMKGSRKTEKDVKLDFDRTWRRKEILTDNGHIIERKQEN